MKNPTPIIKVGSIEPSITNQYFSFIVMLSVDDGKKESY